VCPSPKGLDPESCKMVCRAVSNNKNLRVLRISVKEPIAADTLYNVAASSSSLKKLYVAGSFSDAGVARLAQHLRTNTTLTTLHLSLPPTTTGRPSPGCLDAFAPIAQVLDAHNITLENVTLDRATPGSDVAGRIHRLLLRNRRIRQALVCLQPRAYHVSPPGLVPAALGRVSRFPTLLYRFLRQGNWSELSGRLLLRRHGGSEHGRKMRGRRMGSRDGDVTSPTRRQIVRTHPADPRAHGT
jgi:hypothetical protein